MAPIQFGVLAFAYQVVDIAGPTDLLSSANKSALKTIQQYGPIDEDLISRAPEFVFHHIGVSRDPVDLGTSQMTIVPTTTVDECPELDILLVGGPYLGAFDLNPKHADLIRRHVAAGKLLFTTCTGASLVASTGALDGRKATVNNIEYEWVRKRWPKVNWTREKKWIIDGNIWTGSGAIAGTDMVAHWLKENYGLDVLIQAAATLDYEPRDADGLFNVFPQRSSSKGEKISTHVFRYYEE
ncbi:class I glutamine amidotransferase-like protein [Talaromyces proteolyticus]|uniref:Class I glutamine amidotransferase-like protein n=1 Tax=Talaromyces proteolyticus TaxID=1131652 RepID=A0AAD4PT04_9EURO|nr:class I glutamine amidotransferase-like protein [Talaromyces proteolyticus]KAH8692336.1 class I glutamine amidotransferase-like protein [Talaromyces proteolyticus]